MDIGERLQRLQERYLAALSGAVVAKAHYFSLTGEAFATTAAVELAGNRWRQLESRKKAIVARIAYVEQLAREAVT